MPPASAKQPTPGERRILVDWVSGALNLDEETPQAGHVRIHRLNRAEYNNTVRDLFGITGRPADKFPADGAGGGGFDNDADTLYLPPILMERYWRAANDILKEASPRRICFVQPGPALTREAAARRILTYFAGRAYRRPATFEDVALLMRLFHLATARGESFADSIRTSLKAVLISPRFLFRIEPKRGTGVRALDDYELASRLSYFFWSSMPDDALFQQAALHRLHDPAVLRREVERMLANPKAQALSENFTGQWLRTRELNTTAQPDPNRFPEYTPALKNAMTAETTDFVDSVFRGNASLLKLIDANYTYLNSDLARLYGISGVTGSQLRRVYLGDRRRGGVITMGSVLTVSSYPLRTSPVLRGKWVLESLLGTIIPPPPPGAGGLPASDAPTGGLTFRQQLERHRSRPECASCHSKMDPIGFGLENFDAIGRWRTTIGGKPVDSSGVLADGEKFSGPVELKDRLLEQKELFLKNLAGKMLSYALGRGLQPSDDNAVELIVKRVEQNHNSSDALFQAVCSSYPFRYTQQG